MHNHSYQYRGSQTIQNVCINQSLDGRYTDIIEQKSNHHCAYDDQVEWFCFIDSEQKILCEKFKSQVINFQIIVIFKFCKSFSFGYKVLSCPSLQPNDSLIPQSVHWIKQKEISDQYSDLGYIQHLSFYFPFKYLSNHRNCSHNTCSIFSFAE
jgi:hypothetical protein